VIIPAGRSSSKSGTSCSGGTAALSSPFATVAEKRKRRGNAIKKRNALNPTVF